MKQLQHLATRIFDTPLLIAPQKLEVILSVLGPRLGIDAPPVAAALASERAQRKPYAVTSDGIAVIPIAGTLVHRAYGLDAWSGLRSYVEIGAEFEDAVADPAIRGILLDVDSPGGEVAGAFDLADAIYKARGTKPIFAVANNDAFSAAYLLASAADPDRLYLSRTSGVGSVGVIVTHLDMTAADEKAGLKYSIIHAGARKADFHPHAPLSEEARAVLAAEIDRTYAMLVAMVARNRNMAEGTIRVMESGLFFGADAVTARLASRVGTLQDALAELRAATKVSSSRAAMAAQVEGGESTMQKEEANQPAPAPAQPEQQPAVDAEAIRAEAHRQGYAEAREVVELCALAGMPGKAADLLSRQVSPAEARKSLMEARAAEEPPEIRSHVMPDTGTGASTKPEDSPVMKAVERLAGKGVN